MVQHLRKGLEWQAILDSGQVPSRAAIACREGITRARVTQIMGLLRLPPEIREGIVALPASVHRRAVTERALRSVVRREDVTN